MEALINITMTEQEYAEYKEKQAALEKDVDKLEATQRELVILAQMVSKATKRIFDGAKMGLHTANLLYDKAETLLYAYGNEQSGNKDRKHYENRQNKL